MNKVSDRLNRLSESATLAMSRKSREMVAQGHDIINLSLGEPDFHTPDFIKDAAIQAIRDNYTKYMAVPGYLDLRESICEKFRRDNGLEYVPDQIVVSTGAKHSIANVIMSLIDKGDEVIILAPFWVTYLEIVKMANGTPIEVQASLENDFKTTPEELEAAITPNTRLIIFSSPCNPTGSVYSAEELEGLAKVIESHDDLYVISDEIYEHINFERPHASIARYGNMMDRTITVNGVSKAWAMTGWRLGYLAAPQWIANACVKLQGQFTSGSNGISQRAAKAAVEADPSLTADMVAAFRERRELVVNRLQEMAGIEVNMPEGAFYVFPDVSSYFGKSDGTTTIHNASDLSMYLLHDAKVATVTGEAFGAPKHIRFSYAAANELLIEALNRIEHALKKLK